MENKKLYLKLLVMMVSLVLMTSLIPHSANAQTRPITMEFDGRIVASDVAPILVGTSVMVPLRTIFETMGATVTWDVRTQTVTGQKADNMISLIAGQRTAVVNGATRTLDQPAQMIGGRILVPFRFVGEALGAKVEWDSARRIARIISTENSRRRSPVDREFRLVTGGATFPFPLYTRLLRDYSLITNPVVRIDYASVGSGAGIRGILAGTFDFAGTDAPLTAEQRAQVAPNEIFHVPVVLGAVAVVYNVPGVATGLRLSPDVLSDIFLGAITNWNDTRIAALNPRVRLPDQRITVVRRADSSGTTFIFTDYLSVVSERWRTGPGRGTTVVWPSPGNIGGRGNEGVAAQVAEIPGTIGYLVLSYAFLNRLNIVDLQNRAGNFITPTVISTVEAAAGLAQEIARDTTISLVNSPGRDAYPIVGLTWILVHRDQADLAKAQVIVDFLRWSIVERNLEPLAVDLYFSPLPQQVIERVRTQLLMVNHQGRRIWR